MALAVHVIASWRYSALYRRVYPPGKVFLGSSFVVAGWWISGEREFREFVREQADVDHDARRSREHESGVRFVAKKRRKRVEEEPERS